ncbi:hypothetical protein M431DRAFT_362601 [Trichoderma harzianum CBS 226.95]|uniref:Uncharacterized protein n=1 Tax=Trichoderma harzianum CBS 226.95 TaxID=983964 RepID=A0A2T4AML0_TRIHA|nr:hypothetical protein M431DRAFT_362601 [Trichoderma harzianum CBS 226.95]PTB58317.1 hypothetical protein M431DRAFT_362601 [Trichoderma harzianum CBS 226.95]
MDQHVAATRLQDLPSTAYRPPHIAPFSRCLSQPHFVSGVSQPTVTSTRTPSYVLASPTNLVPALAPSFTSTQNPYLARYQVLPYLCHTTPPSISSNIHLLPPRPLPFSLPFLLSSLLSTFAIPLLSRCHLRRK